MVAEIRQSFKDIGGRNILPARMKESQKSRVRPIEDADSLAAQFCARSGREWSAIALYMLHVPLLPNTIAKLAYSNLDQFVRMANLMKLHRSRAGYVDHFLLAMADEHNNELKAQPA
jgi:hypothetical protein